MNNIIYLCNIKKTEVIVMTINHGATKKSIKNILKNLAKELKPKGVNVYKYVGKISFKKDGLSIQKELRNY